MTTLSNNELQRLALLANLEISEDELLPLQKNIGDILGYITQLKDIDTSGVAPTYQVTGLQNVWRADKVDMGSVSREQLLELSPEVADNSVKVPKVL